ncbi:MAG: hypothetical protein DLM54_09675 [Acidimicrobiales bacterium]|nr:MAG: hypothetical protein DLM54_09675 [Acidimicrobiales bacterium]
MVAGEESCACPQCGVVCTGRFSACAEVWLGGPKFEAAGATASLVRQSNDLLPPAELVSNGSRRARGSLQRELAVASSPVGGQDEWDLRVKPVDFRPRRGGARRSQEEAVSEVDLADELVAEVASSVTKVVFQAMGDVIESHRAVLASLARLEEDQEVTRQYLGRFVESTGISLTTIAALVEERSEWNEERFFDLASRVTCLTDQLRSVQADLLLASTGGAAVSTEPSATESKRAGTAHSHSSVAKAIGPKSR